MGNNSPNLLVISHNPFSITQSNGKTLEALAADWDKKHLAQLFLSGEPPDFDFCCKYFAIPQEKILLKLRGKDVSGYQVKPSGDSGIIRPEYEEPIRKISRLGKFFDMHFLKWFVKILRYILNIPRILSILTILIVSSVYWRIIAWFFNWRKPLPMVIQNTMWSKSWHSEKLDKWLDDFSPNAVLFQNSAFSYAFDIADYICNRYKIPMVMESTDDYFTGKFSLNPFFWIKLHNVRRRYIKAVKYSHCVYAIGDKMADEYSRRFGGCFKVAMNSVDIAPQSIPSPLPPGKMQIFYAGNLHSGRWKILEKVGRAVKLLEKEGVDAELVICSLIQPGRMVLRRLSIPGRMRYIGALDSEQMRLERSNSTLLLHVENFSAADKFITRLSVSTKIPEYMASGRCIFAVGPEDVASMAYIRDYDMGVTVNNLKVEDIAAAIKDILIDEQKRMACIANAYRTVCDRHDRKKVAEDVKKELLAACGSFNKN